MGRGALRLYVVHQRSGAGAGGREVPWNARGHCQILLPHPAESASAKAVLRSDVMPPRCAPVSDRLPSASPLLARCRQVSSAELLLEKFQNCDCSPKTRNAYGMVAYGMVVYGSIWYGWHAQLLCSRTHSWAACWRACKSHNDHASETQLFH